MFNYAMGWEEQGRTDLDLPTLFGSTIVVFAPQKSILALSETAFGDLACPTGPADWLHVVLVKNLRAHAGKFRHDSFSAR